MEKNDNISGGGDCKKKDLSWRKAFVPASKEYHVDDVTPEALVGLCKITSQCWWFVQRQVCSKFRRTILQMAFQTYDLFLEMLGWWGYQKDRCNTPPIYLKTAVSVDMPLRSGRIYFRRTFRQTAFRTSGMIARFLYCFPKSECR